VICSVVTNGADFSPRLPICTLGSFYNCSDCCALLLDWHAEISVIIHNRPHWNRRIFRTWGYRGNITIPLRSRNLATELSSGSRGVVWSSWMSEKKGLEVLPSRSKCELRVRPETLSSGLNMSQLVSRVRCLLATLLMRHDTCRDLGEVRFWSLHCQVIENSLKWFLGAA